jgi:hypothetical protein
MVGRAWRRALYTRSSPFYVGDCRTVSGNQLEGVAWCRWDDELLAWRRALYTRSTLFNVGVGRTSVAPSALHTLFSSVTWWRAHNLPESGTDSYTRRPDVVTREVKGGRPPAAQRRRGVRSQARRHPLTSPWWALETP